MLLKNQLAQLESWASPWSQLVRQSSIRTIWIEMGLLQENECVLLEGERSPERPKGEHDYWVGWPSAGKRSALQTIVSQSRPVQFQEPAEFWSYTALPLSLTDSHANTALGCGIIDIEDWNSGAYYHLLHGGRSGGNKASVCLTNEWAEQHCLGMQCLPCMRGYSSHRLSFSQCFFVDKPAESALGTKWA